MTAVDVDALEAARERLMSALVPATIVDGSPIWRSPGELADSLLPVVQALVAAGQAEALEAAAKGFRETEIYGGQRNGMRRAVELLDAQVAALRATTSGEGAT